MQGAPRMAHLTLAVALERARKCGLGDLTDGRPQLASRMRSTSDLPSMQRTAPPVSWNAMSNGILGNLLESSLARRRTFETYRHARGSEPRPARTIRTPTFTAAAFTHIPSEQNKARCRLGAFRSLRAYARP